VACALIERNGLVLAAQRSNKMSMPLKWEFPGGKIADGETPEDCLRRELLEEMGVAIELRLPLTPSEHHYPDFSVILHPFICTLDSEQIMLYEHASIAWKEPKELLTLDWVDADIPVIEQYMKILDQ